MVLSANDLKPRSSSDCKCMVGQTSGLTRSIQQACEGYKRKTHNLKGSGWGSTTGCSVSRASVFGQVRGEDEREELGQLVAPWSRLPSPSPSPGRGVPPHAPRYNYPPF